VFVLIIDDGTALLDAMRRFEMEAYIARAQVNESARALDRLAGSMRRAVALAADALPRLSSVFDRYDFGALSGVPVYDHAPPAALEDAPGILNARSRALSLPLAAQRPCLDGGSMDYG
jgi:hypothetical protein